MRNFRFVVKGLVKALFFIFFLMGLAACAGTPPTLERAKAVEAERYAKRNYARKYASNYYRKGAVYLKKAHEHYENRVYSKAKQAYDMARLYFEKAETKSRISQIKQGGEF